MKDLVTFIGAAKRLVLELPSGIECALQRDALTPQARTLVAGPYRVRGVVGAQATWMLSRDGQDLMWFEPPEREQLVDALVSACRQIAGQADH